jgi:hypothetical protein
MSTPTLSPSAPAVAATRERPELAALDTATVRAALMRMHLIRKFEETAEASYMRGLIHGTMHLSIGQEASAVGAILPLRPDDYILSTHRGHGHCIAKGADPARMLAEFFGKENGYCRGRGGSMHIADVEGGNLGCERHRRGRAADRRRRGHEHQDAEAGSRLHGVLRRWRDQRGRVSRSAQHGVDLEAAGRLRLREQQVRHVDGHRPRDGGARTSPIARAPTRCPVSRSTATTCLRLQLPRVSRSTARAPAPARRSWNARRIAGAAIRRAIATSTARRTRSRPGASAIRSGCSKPN